MQRVLAAQLLEAKSDRVLTSWAFPLAVRARADDERETLAASRGSMWARSLVVTSAKFVWAGQALGRLTAVFIDGGTSGRCAHPVAPPSGRCPRGKTGSV